MVDGIIGGVGAVIVFLPNIMILYLFISFMEDSGYLARAAFIMDRVMHRIGLHGKSFIPLIMGFGCNVPAIMACRTIESRSSRLITILITPFMSCSARIPIYLLLAGTFFAADASMVMIGLYVLGVVLAVVTARLMRRFMFPVDETPFVMELPPYRLPTWKTTLTHMWDKCAQYLRKMGGMILVASVVVWFLSYYPRTDAGNTPEHYENSYLGRLGRTCEPVFSPLGLNWKAGVALLSGVPAKEIIVSTLGVLYSEGAPAAANTAAQPSGTIEIVAESGEMTDTAKLSINDLQNGKVAVIGGADGPTAIYIAENGRRPAGPKSGNTRRRCRGGPRRRDGESRAASDGERRFHPRLGAGVPRIHPALLPLHRHGRGHRFGGGLAMGRRQRGVQHPAGVAGGMGRLSFGHVALIWDGRIIRYGRSERRSRCCSHGGSGASSGGAGAADARRAPVRSARSKRCGATINGDKPLRPV